MITGIQKPDMVHLDREMDNLTSELKLLIALLYEVGEEFLSKPYTAYNEAIINATAWLIDLLSEEVSCG